MAIVNSLKKCNIFLYLFSGIEIHAADNLVWDVGSNKFLLEKTRLCVGSVKHSTVLIARLTLSHESRYRTRHIIRFLEATLKLFKCNPVSGPVVSPKALVLSTHVVGNDAVGGI